MATLVTVLWTAPGISLQMRLLTFPLFLHVAMATEQTGNSGCDGARGWETAMHGQTKWFVVLCWWELIVMSLF